MGALRNTRMMPKQPHTCPRSGRKSRIGLWVAMQIPPRDLHGTTSRLFEVPLTLRAERVHGGPCARPTRAC